MKIFSKGVWGLSALVCLAPAVAQGQAQEQPPAQAPQPAVTVAVASDPDSRVDALQPDFTLAALPTTLRMPKHKFAFRVTHRFTRSLGRGDFGDLLNDFFGFDSGAQIGLELRYGLLPGTQIGIHRTSDRTIQIFGQQSVMKQAADGHPIGLDVMVTWEGTDNMRGQQSSTIGVLASRKVGRFMALYAEPMFVVNSSPFDNGSQFDTGENNTAILGLGTRLRIRPSTYIVGEWTPRLSGYRPGVDQGSVGIEMRSGGHTFQINFSNGFGTTLGQVARGGISSDSWYIGFNISRKFF
jgi:hypothetical protein